MRKLLNLMFQSLTGQTGSRGAGNGGARAEPRVIPRPDHIVSRKDIPPHALKVLYRLNKAGYQSYLVGGGVRDLLLGSEPKDFDVATDARPEQVRKVFSNCRLIGRRFRLAHVHFGRDIIEVATFRGGSNGEEGAGDVVQDKGGRLLRDNVYGTMEEDAWRRDFTINGLYYSIDDFSIIDYVGGMEDIERRLIHLIGDVETRYREDPVRMLRAARFAAKLGFDIERDTAEGIGRFAPLLAEIAPARLFDECLKLFMAGYGRVTFDLLREYGLFAELFPATEAVLRAEGDDGGSLRLLRQAMANTDQRVSEGRPVTPAFLFAALLWPPVREGLQQRRAEGLSPGEALQRTAASEVGAADQRVALPKRFRIPMREIWQLQPRFERRQGKRVWHLMGHPRFRAAYDFLLLRAHAGEVEQELADWWTRVQEVDRGEQETMINAPAPQAREGESAPASAPQGRPRRRRRRGGRRRGPPQTES